MTRDLIVDLRQKAPAAVGGKAAGLHWLFEQGARVPVSFAITSDAAMLLQNEDGATRAALSAWLDPDKAYAVRSSANVEDGRHHSFAGQFRSHLHVRGLDGVVTAVIETLAAVKAPEVGPYARQAEIDLNTLRMGVIIQEMVSPRLSGVAFSKNPLTGLDEVVVEAVSGAGTALVQGGITPRRWVHKWGAWLHAPKTNEDETAVIADVVAETKRLAAAYGQAIDLEWVFDGEALYWVQVRPITRLDGLDIYSNRIAREVLPGIIKPLVWSVNIPGVNGAWTDLFTELIGPNDIDPNGLAKAFYHRAYFNMGIIGRVFATLGMPEESLELLMGLEGGAEKPRFRPSGATLRHLPRMVGFLLSKARFGRRVERFLAEMEGAYGRFDITRAPALDAAALRDDIDRLTALYRRCAYFNIVTPLLAMAYDALLRRQLNRHGVDPERLDLMAGLAALEAYDPNRHLRRLRRQFDALAPEDRAQVAAGELAGGREFASAVDDFIAQFGHLSDSGNDLSSVPWREDRQLVLKLIANYVDLREESARLTWDALPLGRANRVALTPLYRRARSFRYYREAVSSIYTFGYGLFRIYFLEIGRRLEARGILSAPDDIFFLYRDEALAALEDKDASPSLSERVAERRATIDSSNDVVLPDIIYGEEPPPLATLGASADELTGIPTSRGYYRGLARVIESVAAFDELAPGDVLVIPHSDVAWSPLFARAGAIVAESGGMLSHSSIVAREYGLPAVVSVSGACRLLDGCEVTVDGVNGRVILHAGPAVEKVRSAEAGNGAADVH